MAVRVAWMSARMFRLSSGEWTMTVLLGKGWVRRGQTPRPASLWESGLRVLLLDPLDGLEAVVGREHVALHALAGIVEVVLAYRSQHQHVTDVERMIVPNPLPAVQAVEHDLHARLLNPGAGLPVEVVDISLLPQLLQPLGVVPP